MRAPQAILFCLLGATQLAWGQVKEPVAHTIPGYLDPATGKFTTKLDSAAKPQATTALTSVFFREDFQIKITNYDQPGTTAICSVDLSSYESSSGANHQESASVAATASGGGFSCDVPVLTLWQLQSPTSDTIEATVTVTIFTPGGITGQYGTPAVYRSSTQSLTVAQPGNTQTVVNAVNFSL